MVEKQFKYLQEVVDRCIKRDYAAMKEAFSMKKDYLNYEQRPDYIRKEIFRVTEEIVSINQKFPALKSFAFDWHIPSFIWESSFFERLTPAERKKITDFRYENFDDSLYLENPTSYDESLPYFSSIVKMVVSSKYLEDLQEVENNLLHPSEPIDETIEVEVQTEPEPEPEEKILPKKIVGKENPFNCKLDSSAIKKLTNCVNEAHIFTTEITPQILEDFFYCRLTGALKSSNNRLLAYFMMKLSAHGFITYEWQSVISNYKLVFAPKKEKYLNSSDLSTANDSIKYIPPKKSEIIDSYVKQLKKH